LAFVVTAAVLTWYFVFFAQDPERKPAMCSECHCIVDGNATTSTCPATSPVTEYSEDTIDIWKSQTALNPYTINCNPYEDGTMECDLEPALDKELLRLGEAAVCAVHYEQSAVLDIGDSSTCQGASYSLKTYASREEAEAAGGFVTHIGHCGVCSTMQDLAVYAEHMQATSPGNFCRRQAMQSLENGIACYRNLGMTQDCARLWTDTSWNTARNCFGSCVLDPTIPQLPGFGTDSDGEPKPIDFNVTNANTVAALEEQVSVSRSANNTADDSICQPSQCFQCDEKISGFKFERYAGRSRRRSGMLATDAFQCSKLPNIVQDPCPVTTPLA
jgi:hypothetical protein